MTGKRFTLSIQQKPFLIPASMIWEQVDKWLLASWVNSVERSTWRLFPPKCRPKAYLRLWNLQTVPHTRTCPTVASPAFCLSRRLQPQTCRGTHGTESLNKALRRFRPLFGTFVPFPAPHPCPQNQSMERPTTEQLETMRDIDDLHSTVANLRRQLDFANQQLRTMRIQVNRYERVLGMDETGGRMSHTPGPWRIEGEFDADTGVSVVADLDGELGLICELEQLCGDWDESEIADALLIAAAPELLEGLKETKDAAADELDDLDADLSADLPMTMRPIS